MKKFATLAAAAALLAACTSAPPLIRSYTLASTSTAPSPVGERLQFRLLNVNVPARLNSEIMVAQSRDGASYELADETWAAPFPDELRNAISADLTQQLPGIDVTYIAAEPQRPVYTLRVSVQNFFTIVGEQTSLAASWSLSGGESPINCVGTYNTKLPAENRVNVQSYRELTTQLSTDIIKSFGQYKNGLPCG